MTHPFRSSTETSEVLVRGNMNTEKIMCPQCHASGMCVVIPRLSCISHPVLIAGGFVMSFIWSGGLPTDFRCTACGQRFARRTWGARVAFLVFWTLLGVVGLGLLVGLARPG